MPPTTVMTYLLRPEDFVLLGLEFREVGFSPPQPGQAGMITGQGSSYLIVHWLPQHIAEEAFSDPLTLGDFLPTPGQVQSRLSGYSRIVYTIPAGTTLPFTTAGVLGALMTLPLSVAPVAAFERITGCSPQAIIAALLQQPPEITQPTALHTQLELPYRVILSPDRQGRWEHSTEPVTRDGRSELWHSRLGSRRASGLGDPNVRAIWSPDYHPLPLQPEQHTPFRMSLWGRIRNQIVQLTSNYHIDKFQPSPVRTERLMLTGLGGWLRVQGDWEPPTGFALESWRHEATIGRDQYVRVVEAGYLLPFGHRASRVTITERKLYHEEHEEGQGNPVAYLRQRRFIIVREPIRQYGHRHVPFRKVELRTRVTPDLVNADGLEVWVQVRENGSDVYFPFHLTGTDWEGRASDFTLPLLWVEKTVAEGIGPNAGAPIFNTYNSAPASRRQSALGGQPIAYAPASRPADTTQETTSLLFGMMHTPAALPFILPTMQNAQVNVPAVKQLTGDNAASTIQFESSYLSGTGGAIGNPAHIYAKVTSNTPLGIPTEKAGGMINPAIVIGGLSRALGPVAGAIPMPASDPRFDPKYNLPQGDIGAMLAGTFDPFMLLGNGVKLLGGIELRDILRILDFPAGPNIDKLPNLTTVRDGDILRTRYRWVASAAELVDTGLFKPAGNAEFVLDSVIEKNLKGGDPTFRLTGKLTNFAVLLIPGTMELIRLDFTAVTFTGEKDKKVDVSVELAGVTFLGLLGFVNELKDFIPLDGFNDPPSLQLVPPPDAGAKVGFSLGLPTIGIGIFTMQNISLSASVYLPFVDKPMNFRFAFCERHQPFILTVSLFGGGGFFAIDIGINGVRSLEASLEFGASVALNLGVASGQASIMGGFYFQKAGTGFSLTGYFRASGSLSVLGIISVSCEFYLGLTYESKGTGGAHAGTMWGQAKLTVKIEILFFSMSVSISMEREFAGSDPTFRQLVPPSAWQAYSDAFADYPAVAD